MNNIETENYKSLSPKLGSHARSLFVNSNEKEELTSTKEIELQNKRGRPKQLVENMTKTTLTIGLDQLIWLDRLSSSIRETSHAIIDRGAIIRAIITTIEKSGINITSCKNEEDIVEILINHLKKD
jgi:hypothetical protein